MKIGASHANPTGDGTAICWLTMRFLDGKQTDIAQIVNWILAIHMLPLLAAAKLNDEFDTLLR